MMLTERWAIVALLAVGLTSTAGAPRQSSAQNAQSAQNSRPPWDRPAPPPVQAPAEPDEPYAPLEPDEPPPAQTHPEPQAAPAAPTPQVIQPAPPVQELPKPATLTTPSAPPAGPQTQLQKDSAELLQLVEDLKSEVDKAGNDTLSLAALRKADAIQRMAKILKDKMKDRVQVSANMP
jgi:hypothetical protein